jgi:hypothetical protein
MSSKTRLLDCIHPKSDLVTMVSRSQLANVYLPRLVLTKKKKKKTEDSLSYFEKE